MSIIDNRRTDVMRNTVVSMLDAYAKMKGYAFETKCSTIYVTDELKFTNPRTNQYFVFEAHWNHLIPNAYSAFEFLRGKVDEAMTGDKPYIPSFTVDWDAKDGTKLNFHYEHTGSPIAKITGIRLPKITKVIHNNPATIVFWADKTKTVVKCGDRDIYDPEKGLAMAIAKKALGNKHDYYNIFVKWLKKFEKAKKKKNTRTVIGKVAAIEQTEDGVYARIGLNSTIEAAKLVEAIKKNDPVASIEFKPEGCSPIEDGDG